MNDAGSSPAQRDGGMRGEKRSVTAPEMHSASYRIRVGRELLAGSGVVERGQQRGHGQVERVGAAGAAGA
jgi:hypothetical protein